MVNTDNSGLGPEFGAHVRALREVRHLTQESLAERAAIAGDTVRRLEHGSFSPSLRTLRKLCAGLEITLGTLFSGYELREVESMDSVGDLLRRMPPAEIVVIGRVLRAVIAALDLAGEGRAIDGE